MIEVGKKDRIFVALVLPLVLIGCYVYFWRMPVTKRLAALESEYRQLPDPDSFPVERRNLNARVAEAEKALAAARAEKPVASMVEGDPQTSVASRLDQVLSVWAAKGVRIVRVDVPLESELTGEAAQASRGKATLEATGLRPTPSVRTFVLEADYPSFSAALKEFVRQKMAVVPERISLKTGDRSTQWELALWL